jgi:protein-S-isoprenylcysteine O-methyltransferase Ste14
MAWSCLPLPLGLRWCGALLGVAATLLLLWVHRSLGQNFSPQLRIRQEHALCTGGLYRWIRHPMYTVLFVLSVAWIIGLANWFVGVFWLTMQAIVIGQRVGKEEAELLEHFGDEYRAYMRRTGRFLPRLW